MATNQAPQIENAQIAQIAAKFAGMSDDKLPQYTKDLRYGALALAEISRRNRINMMNEAAKAQGAEGGTISDQQIGQMMQAKMRERMMNDDRLGLNNIVASAEQGGVDFGPPAEEPQSMAGGGMVSFERGGPIQYDDGSQGYFLGGLLRAGKAGIDALRGMTAYEAGRLGGRGVAAIKNNPERAAVGGASALALPFFGGGDDGGSRTGLGTNFFNINNEPEGSANEPPVSDTYPDETQRGSAKGLGKPEGKSSAVAVGKAEKEDAKVIAKELGTDAKSILEARRKLEKEMGLGEYGAEAKAVLEKRRQRAEKAGEAEYIEKLQEGIKALGGKRRTDTIGMLGEGLGALSGAMGAEKKVKASAQDAADEIEQKMAMAKDLYMRGDIANAQKMAMEAQKDQRDYELNMRKIASLEKYYGDMGAAARAKGAGGGFKLTDPAKVSAEITSLQDALRRSKDPAQQQIIMQRIKMLNAYLMRGLMGGISIEDQPDAE